MGRPILLLQYKAFTRTSQASGRVPIRQFTTLLAPQPTTGDGNPSLYSFCRGYIASLCRLTEGASLAMRSLF